MKRMFERFLKPRKKQNQGFENDEVTGSICLIITIFLLCLTLMIWAWGAVLDEVSSGAGKVIPSTREQIVQLIDGGVLLELNVREGETVNENDIIAKLDPTRHESNVGESLARYHAALAASARLHTEVNDLPLHFPDELQEFPELIASETRLFNSRRKQLNDATARINESLSLVNNELLITERLAKNGAASEVEVLRLRRQQSELRLKLTEIISQYYVQAREELAKGNAEVASLAQVIKGRADSLARLVVRSPVRGIVKNIKVMTIGGVIPANGVLMEIVPLDDHLLIEVRISPRDIAFIYPGQQAMVKISAYDYAIYGGMTGVVESISPDTLQDEVRPEIYYYRVFIKTDVDYLKSKSGAQYAIVPGIVATVDIKTGEKTILNYLIKPFNTMREALRER
ncbi:Membrane fusion protein (MFP) family protein [Edwardsiella anguillarum]|nr:Membrane fusion protein (MFP) family protein [Edwardsiella anguillarum]BET83886.1 Membrane fusion protein (MFP) family protein [Edwardsiella anguillarum]BET87253.1 Membrane fusion protein (MFP) family protein [Edwardsiella anguillarum]BET90679.1 Membrane fusion protein (MFP) family protein [Edwardsiella anguillarum]GAJ68272.1 membrane fusion protein of T1SS [Edwardsiella piscicida]